MQITTGFYIGNAEGKARVATVCSGWACADRRRVSERQYCHLVGHGETPPRGHETVEVDQFRRGRTLPKRALHKTIWIATYQAQSMTSTGFAFNYNNRSGGLERV